MADDDVRNDEFKEKPGKGDSDTGKKRGRSQVRREVLSKIAAAPEETQEALYNLLRREYVDMTESLGRRPGGGEFGKRIGNKARALFETHQIEEE